MIRHLKAFGAFWWDFVIGEDWRVAAGVVLALTATFLIARTGIPAWPIVPAAVLVFLARAVGRAGRRR